MGNREAIIGHLFAKTTPACSYRAFGLPRDQIRFDTRQRGGYLGGWIDYLNPFLIWFCGG
jgi:hypothetical protein